MAIAGVVVKVISGQEEFISAKLNELPGVEIVKITDGNIVVVLERQDLSSLEEISTQQIQGISGVLAVLPAYINHEEFTDEG
jgi:nitrate reductase NapAB chaperone NapD